MRVEIVMPQMGESIAEGTITRWMKKIGERVERDEPILEISTDKVDAEIPSPASGVLAEIRNKEGETVEVNRVLAVIETDEKSAGKAPAAGDPPAAGRTTEQESRPASGTVPAAAKPAGPAAAGKAGDSRPPQTGGAAGFISPLVRRMAAEHGIDPRNLSGTGAGGRVTKKDIAAFLDQGSTAREQPAPGPQAPSIEPAALPASDRPSLLQPHETTQKDAPSFPAGQNVVRLGMSQMRKKIAEHMVESRRTSAHVHSVFEIDMTRVVRLRDKYKQAYLERHGTKLTFMPFFIKAVCDGLRAWPIVNSSVENGDIVYRKELHIGIAVALDWGLIVPVVRHADELSLAGLSKKVNDLAERARTKKLNPDEVHGGTFTITNPGSFGGLYGLPIINQPQVAILGIGAIKKRPVVLDDAIAIRSMVYVSMSYDHRVVDGAVADQFLARLKHALEHFDESLL